MRENDHKDFEIRRQEARQRIFALDALADKTAKREGFFDMVYENAAGDGAAVPWADLDAKPQLKQWLAENPAKSTANHAVDVACGLGDHGEAMSAAGYSTIGFDLAPTALKWARKRFPESKVDYRQIDLFDMPDDFPGKFNLVYECYTIQSIPGELHGDISRAIASLVAPGGTLLVIARTRAEDENADGPPWHLAPSEYNIFKHLGFKLHSESIYEVARPDKSIPHVFAEWRRKQVLYQRW